MALTSTPSTEDTAALVRAHRECAELKRTAAGQAVGYTRAFRLEEALSHERTAEHLLALHAEVRRVALAEAWEWVNVLGGCRPDERNYDQGYVDAIGAALDAIEKLQGAKISRLTTPPPVVTEEEVRKVIESLAHLQLNFTSEQIDPHQMFNLVAIDPDDEGCDLIGAEIIRARAVLAHLNLSSTGGGE